MAAFQTHGIEPKLRFTLIVLDMNMRWFVAVARVEEESVWAVAKDRRHSSDVNRVVTNGERGGVSNLLPGS